jgi:hypothetical protein
VSCDAAGIRLAGVDLLRQSASGFAVRPLEELAAIGLLAYGAEFNSDRLCRGLVVATRALNEGDLGRAMIATVQLRLPGLDEAAAARIARFEDELAKYDPGQPRDWHGRWTTGDGGGPTQTQSEPGSAPREAEPRRAEAPKRPSALEPRKAEPGSEPPKVEPARIDTGHTEGDWGGPSHPTGGSLILTGGAEDEPGIGDNEPPLDPPIGPGVEPALSPPKVPEGWDVPAQTDGGLLYPATRFPKFKDGTPWPTATPDNVLVILRQGRPPAMVLFVPQDRVGPTLIGSTADREYELPPGYDPVRLVGLPQSTSSLGVETKHAIESVREGLRMAETNTFSSIYFNRSFTTLSDGEISSPLRPDVVGVLRPEARAGYRFDPYEVYSPGQKPEARENQLKDLPWINLPLRGDHYKLFRAAWVAMMKYLAS